MSDEDKLEATRKVLNQFILGVTPSGISDYTGYPVVDINKCIKKLIDNGEIELSVDPSYTYPDGITLTGEKIWRMRRIK